LAAKTTVFVRGKILWARIVGDPVPNFNQDAREWKFELEPDEAGLQALIKNGLTDRIKGRGYFTGQKNQHKDREPFIVLKKSELNKEGSPNSPIRVYDADDNKWDDKKLIGNNSVGDVKLDIRDYGVGKKKGVYPEAVRV
jgi:hypothetical protein